MSKIIVSRAYLTDNCDKMPSMRKGLIKMGNKSVTSREQNVA